MDCLTHNVAHRYGAHVQSCLSFENKHFCSVLPELIRLSNVYVKTVVAPPVDVYAVSVGGAMIVSEVIVTEQWNPDI